MNIISHVCVLCSFFALKLSADVFLSHNHSGNHSLLLSSVTEAGCAEALHWTSLSIVSIVLSPRCKRLSQGCGSVHVDECSAQSGNGRFSPLCERVHAGCCLFEQHSFVKFSLCRQSPWLIPAELACFIVLQQQTHVLLDKGLYHPRELTAYRCCGISRVLHLGAGAW